MAVKTDSSGKRFVELEFDLPGTPEQIWHAVATSTGMSAWFTPTDVEEREGGEVVFHLGEGMDSRAEITTWQPPEIFAYVEREWSEGAPELVTEVAIAPQSDNSCKIKLVHSLITSDQQWDDSLESMEKGWPPYFNVLDLYLTHFAGLSAASIRVVAPCAGSEQEVWQILKDSLGLTQLAVGDHCVTSGSAPKLAGIIHRLQETETSHELTLLMKQPCDGAAILGAFTCGGVTHYMISLFLYGENAAEVAAAQEPLWKEWAKNTFPALIEGSDS